MDTFRLKFSNYNEVVDGELYKYIVTNCDQYESASSPYKDKSKDRILSCGANKRENLIEKPTPNDLKVNPGVHNE